MPVNRRSQNRQKNNKSRWIIVTLIMIVILLGILLFFSLSVNNKNKTENNLSESVSKTASVENKSSSKSNNKSTASNIKSYAVDYSDLSGKEFTHKGINSPNKFAFNASDNTGDSFIINISYPSPVGSDSHSRVRAYIEKVPMKEIKLFSANSSDIRTVKVETAIVVESAIEQNNSKEADRYVGNVYYLFYNSEGGISLATPNYAGNVLPDDSDVMAEYID